MKTGKAPMGALLLLALGATTGTVAFVVSQMDQRERDWRAVVGAVADIERKLRVHDGGLWFLVEEGLPPGPHPDIEPVHERIQAELERLAHLEDARLVVEHVDLGLDTATVDYRIEASPVQGDSGAHKLRVRERPAPEAGQFTFRRGKDRWILSGHRFLEAAQAKGTINRVRSRQHTIALWLGVTAAVALVLAAALLLLPIARRAGAKPPEESASPQN